MTVDYISRSYSGAAVCLSVGLTRSVRMGDGACTAIPPSRFGLPLDALLRRIGLFERGAYAERAYGRWSVYCSFLPYGSGYHHWCEMAFGHAMVTRRVSEEAA